MAYTRSLPDRDCHGSCSCTAKGHMQSARPPIIRWQRERRKEGGRLHESWTSEKQVGAGRGKADGF